MADTPGSQYATHLAFDVSVTPQAATAVRFVFGGALVQTGITAGEQTAFGRASVANGAHGVALCGIAPPQMGSVRVHDGARDMPVLLHLTQTAGADARNVPFVFGGAQLVTGAGAGDGHGFGVPAVTQPLSVQPAGIAPPGIAAPVVADVALSPCVRLNLTQDAPAHDGRSVRFDFGDAARPVVVPGMAAGAVGVPELAQPLGVRLAGWDALHVGAPFVLPPRVRDGRVNFVFAAPLAGAADFAFDVEFGLGVPGFDAAAFGTATLSNSALGVRPEGWDAQAVGEPSLRLDARILVAGVAPGEFGQAEIYNRTQVIRAGGIREPDGFGRASVQNRSRFVPVAGWASEQYGQTWVSHFLRTVEARGAQMTLSGRARVEHREKRIAPESIYREVVGFPVVSWTRTIAPEGWDSARYLTRIIPEITACYPHGLDATLWGETRVHNRLQVVQVPTLRPPGQEELFYGRAHVYNLRQYIALGHDPNDGLHGAFGIWTRVENRDKRIRAYGFNEQAFGHHVVELAARVVAPAPIAPPVFVGARLVAFGVRKVRTEGIEPPYISHWLRVRNSARVLDVAGVDAQAFGRPRLVNTRRFLRYMTAGNQQIFGTAFVAERVRGIQIEHRYSIAPPRVPLPTVQLLTRYVEAAGFDALGVGTRAELRIHWNRIRPRWTHRDFCGTPQVRNLTPQIYTRGGCWEEFGLGAKVELFTRYLLPTGEATSRYGRARVSDRQQRVTVSGLHALLMGTHTKVARIGTAPYALQHIWLDATGSSAGYGIAPPGGTQANVQVPPPVLNVRTIRVIQSEQSARFGVPLVAANGIRVEPGIRDDLFGTAQVAAKIRYLTVAEWPQREVGEPGRPRISPHTIYAVMEAPAQAKQNHPAKSTLHYVSGWVGFGSIKVTLRNRRISVYGNQMTGYGKAQVENWKRTIQPAGLRAGRFGIPVLPGTRTLTVFNAPDGMAMGRPSVRIVRHGAQTIAPRGWDASVIERTNRVENFHRNIFPRGFLAQQMGASRSGDTRYMWQSLHVGAPDNPPMQGFDAARYGVPWVSHRIRDVRAEGFDAFVCEYDLMNFAARMRVRNAQTGSPPVQPAARTIAPHGFDGSAPATLADVRFGTRYIRPDGDAEQYRKGAPGL